MTATLYLGDCLEEMKKLIDKSIDLILTDPPYNTGMSQKTSNGSTRLSHFFDDDYDDKDYQDLVNKCSSEFFRILKDNSYIYIYKLEGIPKMVPIIKGCGVFNKSLYSVG